ncbi:MAG TPA: DUF1501 domain-containing protein [Blastocatellia bacterium]|nr:DUF1501 domain-containing protein [Blastocatellia bacterium]HMZ21002.1 DUF1501 domain-containing protein [Blastocatellia bacterium]HNG28810.1 DUF1501 domain-containing protein [Blastocatellia bacterium]
MDKHIPVGTSRRDFLFRAGNGFGALALSSLLGQGAAANPQSAIHNPQSNNPLAPKLPHFAAKAKAVIFLFMVGGPSHMETFDPKPALDKLHGQQMPAGFGEVKSQFVKAGTPLMGSAWKFKKYGQSGIEVSDLLPHTASCVDDLAIIRSCYTESFVHAPAMYQMMSGRVLAAHPSLGSWVTYGLGSESENLPAYCVMTQPQGLPEGGSPMWGAGYLPAVHQGTLLRNGSTPILHLAPPAEIGRGQQRGMLDYLRRMNEMTAGEDAELAARISSYELAFRMQQHAPEAVDLGKESKETKKLYGLDDPETNEFGTRCLLARRLVERGVRFVQLYSGGGPVSVQWDAHDNVKTNHEQMCRWTDKPIAGLLKDLKGRGLLDSTLVVWGSEFGRTPVSENGKGRDHNPTAFTMWMAGGGVKGGQVIGQTDEIGFKTVGARYHPRDIHATILQLLGLDQMKLTFLHNGRFERLTDFGGNVIEQVIA